MMMKGRIAYVLAAILSASLPSSTSAQGTRHTHSFWREITQPGFGHSRRRLAEGVTLLQRVRRLSGPARWATLESAIARFEAADQHHRDDPEVLYLWAVALAAWERPSREERAERRIEEARAMFNRLRRVTAEYRAGNVAFQLAILASRAHDFVTAMTEYQRAITINPSRPGASRDLSTLYANLAEVTMLSGDLEASVRHYEHAIVLARQQGRDVVLARWGLGVALHRLGAEDDARTEIARALSIGGMRPLTSEGVFFEPREELLYYQALGFETGASLLAHSPDDTQSYREGLARAQEAWSAFAERAPHSAHAARARARARAIESMLLDPR